MPPVGRWAGGESSNIPPHAVRRFYFDARSLRLDQQRFLASETRLQQHQTIKYPVAVLSAQRLAPFAVLDMPVVKFELGFLSRYFDPQSISDGHFFTSFALNTFEGLVFLRLIPRSASRSAISPLAAFIGRVMILFPIMTVTSYSFSR